MQHPYDQEAIQERAARHEFSAGLFSLGSIWGGAAAGGLLFEGSGNKLDLLGGVGALVLGSLSGKKALNEARLAGAERATDILVHGNQEELVEKIPQLHEN